MSKMNLRTLYAQDLQRWIKESTHRLRHQNFGVIDIDRMIEELNDLVNCSKLSPENNLTILLTNLLNLSLTIQTDTPDMMESGLNVYF